MDVTDVVCSVAVNYGNYFVVIPWHKRDSNELSYATLCFIPGKKLKRFYFACFKRKQ